MGVGSGNIWLLFLGGGGGILEGISFCFCFLFWVGGVEGMGGWGNGWLGEWVVEGMGGWGKG